MSKISIYSGDILAYRRGKSSGLLLSLMSSTKIPGPDLDPLGLPKDLDDDLHDAMHKFQLQLLALAEGVVVGNPVTSPSCRAACA